jgi:arylsulfatase A-like enzyme
MTGLHPGHAFVRDNRAMKPEGQYPIPADTVTLGKLLKGQGYVTGAFGKWGLGPMESSGDPLRQGIDRFFGFNCQALAHNYYPTSLWDNEKRRALDNPEFSAHQPLPADADRADPKSYAAYVGKQYAPDLIAEQARAFVRDNQSRPFFLYFPTTVPHLALQVPADSLAEYRGAFPETAYDGGKGYVPHQTPRAAYAAMVTRMDREVGRIVNLIQELGLTDDTIFIFSSDNGAAEDAVGGTDSPFFESSGELRGRKGSLYEGGVRAPGIVSWKGRIKPGTTNDRVTGFEDWLPTILELIGAADATPKKIDGVSFAQSLLGQDQPPRAFLYREFPGYGGQQSIRVGDWKAVRRNLGGKKGAAASQGAEAANFHIELFNLATDPGEKHDVAEQNLDVVARLMRLMREQHTPSAEFPFAALDAETKPDGK